MYLLFLLTSGTAYSDFDQVFNSSVYFIVVLEMDVCIDPLVHVDLVANAICFLVVENFRRVFGFDVRVDGGDNWSVVRG